MSAQRKRLKKTLMIIATVVLILLACYLALNPKFYDVRTVENGVTHQFKLNGLKDGLLIPIELETDSEIFFYTETNRSDRVVLEKMMNGKWTKIETSHRGKSYGLRVYADKGSYRIKAGPFHSCYLEFSAGDKRPFTPAHDKEHAVQLKEKFLRNNWFTPLETQSHWYRFTIDRDAEKTLMFLPFKNWKKFGFHVRLYDQSENPIYEKEIFEDLSPNDNVEEYFTTIFSAGTYYLEISKTDPESYGSYSIGFYF